MVKIRPKTKVQMNMTGSCETHSRTKIGVRDVAATIDEPVERDGTNLGPTPTETMMSALVGCTNVISNKIARKMGIRLGRMDITLGWDFDRRGTMLMEEVEQPFTDIRLSVEVETSATKAEMDALRADLKKFCPVAKVIRGSGVAIAETWTLKPLTKDANDKTHA